MKPLLIDKSKKITKEKIAKGFLQIFVLGNFFLFLIFRLYFLRRKPFSDFDYPAVYVFISYIPVRFIDKDKHEYLFYAAYIFLVLFSLLLSLKIYDILYNAGVVILTIE